jgi:FlaA1/EpsC-like NDP-sugar epimerase
MRDNVTTVKGVLLYRMPDIVGIILILVSAFVVLYDSTKIWLGIAFLTFACLWSPVSEWLIRRSSKHQQMVNRKDLSYLIIAVITVVLVSLLVGWAVDRLTALFGYWVMQTWFLLGGALAIISFIRRARQKRSPATVDQEK